MVNKEHKDRLFSLIFGRKENKEWILSLYNAVNGTDYSDADAIEINTIEDAVYMGMKNDVSLLLHGTVNLWGHQSTYNPNLPVRELMYLGKLYDKYIHQHKVNVYGSKLITLPIPKIVVFYNGRGGKADETILRLSDAFPKDLKDVRADVEVTVRMLNINENHNKALMAACAPLSEYAWFVQRIRDNLEEQAVEDAVDMALDEMPEDYQIRQTLIGNRAEVKDMFITEYNEAETMQLFRADGYADGIAHGEALGMLKKAEQVYNNCIERGMSEEDAQAISGLAEIQKKAEASNADNDVPAESVFGSEQENG